jgi:hypothetical protein
MKVRNLLTAICAFAVVSFPTLGFSAEQEKSTPSIVVRGLVMVQLEDRDALRIAVPDAPHHKSMITFVMKDGRQHVFPFKGRGVLTVAEAAKTAPVVKVPEIVRMKELYGEGVEPLFSRSPEMISIPWTAIRSVRTEKVTDVRYTFIRKDNGQELETFRPRQVAESIRIEVSSIGRLDFDHAKLAFGADVGEIRIEHVPQHLTSATPIVEHFHHYMHYVKRPSGKDYDVEPKRVSHARRVSPLTGNLFWINAEIPCCLIAVG